MHLFPHHDQDHWSDAPRWARSLMDAQVVIMIQNECILAKLEQRANKLSPEDQAKVNELFDKATGITSKVGVAEKT